MKRGRRASLSDLSTCEERDRALHNLYIYVITFQKWHCRYLSSIQGIF